MDLDSTVALLSSKLPVGGDPNSVKKPKRTPKKRNEENPEDTEAKENVEPVAVVDSEEDEIFFGEEKSEKELYGKNSKFTRRETLHIGKATPKRSFETPGNKNRIWTEYRTKKDPEFSVMSDDVPDESQSKVDKSEVKAVPSPKPSPRKINKVESAEMKTPPRRILNSQPDDDNDTSKEASLIDVDNDQMFDDSIFTEYDDRNLSCMSAKMTKKWRKKWAKEGDLIKKTFTTETIDRLVAKQETLLKEELEDEQEVVSKSRNLDLSLRDHPPEDEDEDVKNASTFSEWFNTTREEMILYEKFGEDYDEVVNKMTHTQKTALKAEIDGKANLKEEASDAGEDTTVKDNESAFQSALEVIEEVLPVPKPRTLTPVKADHAIARTLTPVKADLAPTPAKSCGRFFKSPQSLQNSPNYLRPTTASKMRMSPRKRDVFLSPGYDNDVTPCPRSGMISSPTSNFTPRHKALAKARLASAVDLNKIVSPVGQYIRSNPVPPIVRQIRPKVTKHFDDDLAAFERDEELCRSTPPSKNSDLSEKKRMFKPLPVAEYKSSKVALEQKVQGSEEMKSLPKVFGMNPSVEAKIIRHVGRERVPKNAEFLHKDSPLGSAVTIRRGNAAVRDSVLPAMDLDETNTMEMSIRQVVELKKMTSNSNSRQN